MRILMLNNEFPPLGGGTGTANRALLRYFSHVPGLSIDLITSALGKEREEEQFSDRTRIFKVPVLNGNIHHSTNRELLRYAARALPLAWKLHHTQAYDLCFAWSALPAGFVAMMLRKLLSLPYLVRVSGPDIPGFEQRYRVVYFFLSPAIQAVWRASAAVVAKSKGEERMITALNRDTKVTLVPNGVDLTAFQPRAPVSNEGPLRLLCVARLIQRKGQHHLIQAVKQLVDEGVDVTLDLVGTGDARASYEQIAQRLGLTDKVNFWGYVPREQIATHYARAHVFVLPSYNEGMSIATLEAMASGLPIVTTRSPGTMELAQDSINGLTFNWGDTTALARHIRCLAGDRARARAMGAASLARAATFSWDKAATLYLKLFSDIKTNGSPLHLKTQKAL